jgi:hypothetical protein
MNAQRPATPSASTLTASQCALLATLMVFTACSESPGRGPDAGLADLATDVTTPQDAANDSAIPGDGPSADAAIDVTPSDGSALADDQGASADSAIPATVFFREDFEDTSFASRGWYDSPKATLSTQEHSSGKSSFVCVYEKGQKGCAGGTPGRHAFTPSESIYVAYDVKYSKNFVGSQVSYHPHEFNIVTTADGKWVGPAFTHLTLYVEQVGGVPLLALQDSKNVDLNCVLLNNGSFVGCNGDFATYTFSEQRSVCACNGLVGDVDGKDCFKSGTGYYSARMWRAKSKLFADQPGPNYKNDWHRVEAYFRMNSIVNGKGVADGVIRYWLDGKLVISSNKVLLRTGAHPTLKFNQFMFGNYIGVGSPVEQTMWVDDLVVASGKP